MRIKLFYDILLVPPTYMLKKLRDGGTSNLKQEYLSVKCIRFVKEISLPCILTRGQIYNMYYDPVSNQLGGNDLEIFSSGAFEDGPKIAPHMIILDDSWLSFDAWLMHECSQEVLAQTFERQVEQWYREDTQNTVDMCTRFKSDGWEEFTEPWEDGDPIRRGPWLSEYHLD